MIEEQQIEAKQQYLRLEILNEGFDPDHFTLWIDKEKAKGSLPLLGCELEQWSMKELMEAVQEYKQAHLPVRSGSNNKSINSPCSPERSSGYGSEPYECSSVHSNSIPVDTGYSRRRSFSRGWRTGRGPGWACTSTSESTLPSRRVTKEKKSFFSTRNIYIMVTQPHGWEVRRRLSDFRWLSQRLRAEFPSVNVPYFDGKDKDDIESYMNYLLTENDVLFSRFLIFFLSCTNMQKFYTKKDKEFNPKSDKILESAAVKFSPTLTPLQKQREKQEKESKQSALSVSLKGIEDEDAQNEQIKLHLFLEEAKGHLLGNYRQYSK